MLGRKSIKRKGWNELDISELSHIYIYICICTSEREKDGFHNGSYSYQTSCCLCPTTTTKSHLLQCSSQQNSSTIKAFTSLLYTQRTTTNACLGPEAPTPLRDCQTFTSKSFLMASHHQAQMSAKTLPRFATPPQRIAQSHFAISFTNSTTLRLPTCRL